MEFIRKVWRYQSGIQKPFIEGQTIQWSKEKLEDTKGVFRSRLLKDRQYNGRKKKNKRTMIYKIPHRKIKIEKHEQIKNRINVILVWPNYYLLWKTTIKKLQSWNTIQDEVKKLEIGQRKLEWYKVVRYGQCNLLPVIFPA